MHTHTHTRAQVRYYEVSEEELEKLREDFKNGRMQVRIEQDTFDMHQYNEVRGWCVGRVGSWVCGLVRVPRVASVPLAHARSSRPPPPDSS